MMNSIITPSITEDRGDKSYLENTFSWVDNQFAGSSCPGMNSPMEVDAEFLYGKGIKGVVSLNEAELQWNSLLHFSIKHIHVPVTDYRPPSVQQMQIIVDFIESLGKSMPILIHCNAGMGRTGTVLASLLVWKHGLIATEAIAKVRKLRRGSVQTYKQEDGVTAWEHYLSLPKC